MNKATLWSFTLILAIALFSCQGGQKDGENQKENNNESEIENQFKHITGNYKVDPAISIIEWAGQQPAGPRNGIVEITNGKIEVKKGEITGGQITIDMTTIEATDRGLSDVQQAELTQSLKSPDFFDVEQYPEAKFVIKSSDVSPKAGHSVPTKQAYEIKGDLTVKGNTKMVSFPVKVKIDEQKLSADANFNIDRTKWGVTHRADSSLGKERVLPEVNIGFMISAQTTATP